MNMQERFEKAMEKIRALTTEDIKGMNGHDRFKDEPTEDEKQQSKNKSYQAARMLLGIHMAENHACFLTESELDEVMRIAALRHQQLKGLRY